MGGQSAPDGAFLARLSDMAERCQRRGSPCYTLFLDRHQQQVAEGFLKKQPVSFCFFGGVMGAERQILGIAPLGESMDTADFPLVALKLSFGSGEALSHRDILGSVLALGIKRESVGEIVVEQGQATVLVAETVAPLLLGELSRVGGSAVTVECTDTAGIRVEHQFLEHQASVSSPRIDAVVAAAIHCSREDAATLIRSGLVRKNGQTIEKLTTEVLEGSELSIRGKGKFLIEYPGGVTKKGRLRLCIKRYV